VAHGCRWTQAASGTAGRANIERCSASSFYCILSVPVVLYVVFVLPFWCNYGFQNPDRRQPQKVKAVIRERQNSDDEIFRYYIMSAESPPYFRFSVPGMHNRISTIHRMK